MTPKLPPRVHLPSGVIVRLDEAAARSAAPAALREKTPCLAHRAVLAAPGVLASPTGEPLAFDDLALRDANVLRALVAWAGVVPEPAASFTCASCGAAFDAAPSTLLEIGPFVDGELDDPVLDAPFDFDAPHPIPALRAGAHAAREVRFAPRTAGDALALFRLPEDAPLRVTPAIVAAMGVVALGRERRATALADALARASDAAFDAVVDLFHEAAYPPRLFGLHRCAACGARNDLDAPLARELARGVSHRSASAAALPRELATLDAFEAEVRRIADPVYRARGVRNVDLVIEPGPPDCDDAGEPLLGSYTPGTTGDELAVVEPPTVRLYLRSFVAQHEEDGPYDVAAEIRETIDHELEHHLNFLGGEDPLHEEEQQEIELERSRLVGRREGARRARQEARGSLAEFAKATWPLWLIVRPRSRARLLSAPLSCVE